MKSPFAITVVLPGYNEEASLASAVQRTVTALRRLSARPEVVFVDDGSTDRTPQIARELAARFSELKVITNPINLGVGTSLLIGFAAATGDLALYNGVDYSLDVEELEQVLPLFPEHDVVVIAREDRSAHSPYRKVTSLTHYWLVRLLFGVRFGDMNFTQVYKRSVLDALRIRARGPAFVTPELLIRAQDHGFKIAQVTLPFLPREHGEAKYGKPRDILWTLADMASFWIERSRGKTA